MAVESSLKTRVRVFDAWTLRGERDATLEMRGRILLVTSVQSQSVLTQVFDTTGATFQKKQSGIGAPLLWWIGVPVALYLLFYVLFVFYAIPAIVVTGVTFLIATRYLTERFRIQRTPVAHIRLNINDAVYDLVLAHTPGDNPTLDAILAKMQPFEECYHRYRPSRFGSMSTDCLMAFPAHFVASQGAVAIGFFFMSALQFSAVCFVMAHDLPTFKLKIHLFQSLAWAGLGMLCILLAVVKYRMKRKAPKIQDALRSVLDYVKAGEFERVRPVLEEARRAFPVDATLHSLSGQIAIATGRYDEARRYLGQLQDAHGLPEQSLDSILAMLPEG